MPPDPFDFRTALAAEVGKRLSPDDPLGPHDVADRLDRAAVRLWRILLLIEGEGPEYAKQVRRSRYHTNAVEEVGKAIDRFLASVDPDPAPVIVEVDCDA